MRKKKFQHGPRQQPSILWSLKSTHMGEVAPHRGEWVYIQELWYFFCCDSAMLLSCACLAITANSLCFHFLSPYSCQCCFFDASRLLQHIKSGVVLFFWGWAYFWKNAVHVQVVECGETAVHCMSTHTDWKWCKVDGIHMLIIIIQLKLVYFDTWLCNAQVHTLSIEGDYSVL